MSPYQYRNSCCKHEVVSRLSYLYNGNPIPRKMTFILKWGPDDKILQSLEPTRLGVEMLMLVALQVGRHLGNNAAEISGKLQISWKTLNIELVPWQIWWEFRKDVFCAIETFPTWTKQTLGFIYDWNLFMTGIYLSLTSCWIQWSFLIFIT